MVPLHASMQLITQAKLCLLQCVHVYTPMQNMRFYENLCMKIKQIMVPNTLRFNFQCKGKTLDSMFTKYII